MKDFDMFVVHIAAGLRTMTANNEYSNKIRIEAQFLLNKIILLDITFEDILEDSDSSNLSFEALNQRNYILNKTKKDNNSEIDVDWAKCLLSMVLNKYEEEYEEKDVEVLHKNISNMKI